MTPLRLRASGTVYSGSGRLLAVLLENQLPIDSLSERKNLKRPCFVSVMMVAAPASGLSSVSKCGCGVRDVFLARAALLLTARTSGASACPSRLKRWNGGMSETVCVSSALSVVSSASSSSSSSGCDRSAAVRLLVCRLAELCFFGSVRSESVSSVSSAAVPENALVAAAMSARAAAARRSARMASDVSSVSVAVAVASADSFVSNSGCVAPRSSRRDRGCDAGFPSVSDSADVVSWAGASGAGGIGRSASPPCPLDGRCRFSSSVFTARLALLLTRPRRGGASPGRATRCRTSVCVDAPCSSAARSCLMSSANVRIWGTRVGVWLLIVPSIARIPGFVRCDPCMRAYALWPALGAVAPRRLAKSGSTALIERPILPCSFLITATGTVSPGARRPSTESR